MPDERLEDMLARYAHGTLTPEQQTELLRMAHRDQAIFDRLVEEEFQRIALSDASFRGELSARLAELDAPQRTAGPPRRRSFFQWLFSPTGIGAAAVCAAAAMTVVMLIPRRPAPGGFETGELSLPALSQTGIAGPPGEADARWKGLIENATPLSKSLPAAALEMDRGGEKPVYRIGDRMRIAFTTPEPANVVLLEQRAGGETLRLFPNVFTSSPSVGAGVRTLVPPAGQGDLTLDGTAGARTLRLLIFPPSVDPFAPGPDARPAVVERAFQVVN